MSETAKRTPGPWKVFYTPDGKQLLGVGRADTAEGITDYRGGLWGDADEAKANARFIVQACNSHDDLVAALEHAVVAIEMVIRNRPQIEQAPTNIALDVIAEEARAALAKAKL